MLIDQFRKVRTTQMYCYIAIDIGTDSRFSWHCLFFKSYGGSELRYGSFRHFAYYHYLIPVDCIRI